MPPKRTAQAAGLGGVRRSTRLRLQQSDALHRNDGDGNQDGDGDEDEDELVSDSPSHHLRTPTDRGRSRSIPTPPSTRPRPRRPRTDAPLPPPPPLPLPPVDVPDEEEQPPQESDIDSSMELDDEPRWQEPDYVETYRHFKTELQKLTGWREIKDNKSGRKKSHWNFHDGDIMDKLCKPFFEFDVPATTTKDQAMQTLCRMDQTATRIVSYVTMGGPKGRDDWYDVFRNKETRKAVVYAVVGFIMQEHVFSSLCYGASDAELETLHRQVDLKYREEDGFYRTKKRERRVRELLFQKNGQPRPFSTGFIAKSKELAWQMYTILAPILALHPMTPQRQQNNQQAVLRVLFELITRAGRLSLQMRLDRNTVYFMTPAHKDEYYDPSNMWVLNDDEMRRNNRYHNDTWDGMPKAKREQWRAAIFDLALVRVCCFPGFLAFKKGGWDKKFKKRGVRVYPIQDKVVALRWGTEKPFSPRNGTWDEWWMVWGEANGLITENDEEDGEDGEGGGS
ncbi:hypothetical protein IWX90DRAFT_249633 [Phyllosticta citrichinensis]|uniref:Uncharacterized protein n=1 Tax=Phyllosticta citrichinensis TaxID=1130410 RepID=A0ABR1XR34_9PEZI